MNKILSIIIPVYNGEKYILNLILPLLSVRYNFFDIIVVDDGSTDGTLQKLKTVNDKRIVIVSDGHHGVSGARKIGVQKSDSEFVMFFDADDYIDICFFDYFIENINQLRKYDLSAFKIYINDEPLDGPTLSYNISGFCISEYAFGKLNDDLMNAMFNKVYKRNIVEITRHYEDVKIGEDYLFNLSYLSKCNNIAVIDKPFYHYVIRDGSAMRNQRNMIYDYSLLYCYVKKDYGYLLDENTLKMIGLSHSKILFEVSYPFSGGYSLFSDYFNEFTNTEIFHDLKGNRLRLPTPRERVFNFLLKNRMKKLLYVLLRMRNRKNGI